MSTGLSKVQTRLESLGNSDFTDSEKFGKIEFVRRGLNDSPFSNFKYLRRRRGTSNEHKYR